MIILYEDMSAYDKNNLKFALYLEFIKVKIWENYT